MKKRILFLALAVLILPSRAGAQPSHGGDGEPFTVKKIAQGVYAAISHGPTPPAISNSAFIILSDSVLVVDSHMTTKASRALLSEIKKATDKPVRYLVQTHFHGDHVGGNPVFPDAIDIMAHTRTRAHLSRSNPTGARLPTATVDNGITFHRGREVQVRFSGRGHTDGDLYVWLPKERILIAGDLLFNGYIGFMKDAYISDWSETLGVLIRLRPRIVVPGHGEVGDVNALKIFRTFLWDFINAVKKEHAKGLSGQQIAKNFELPPSYRSWGMQKKALKANVLRMYYELEKEQGR